MNTDSVHARQVPRAVTGFVENLSAAYAAIGLYGPEHPFVAALAEAVADCVASLRVGQQVTAASCSLQIARGMFLWQGSAVAPRLVSQLASDLHALNAVELQVIDAINAASTHTLLCSIYATRRQGGAIEEVIRAAEELPARPIRIVPLATGSMSLHALAIADESRPDAKIASDAELGAMLRKPPEDPAAFAEQIARHVEAGGAERAATIREWLAAQTDGAFRDVKDEEALRRQWLASCIQQLTPEVRESLLRSTPQPEPQWLMSAARLAPVWPAEELIAALEGLTGDVTMLRGTGRILFAQLLGLATQGEQQRRVRSIIATWGSKPASLSLFATGAEAASNDQFRAEDYAEELLQYATQQTPGARHAWGLAVEDDEQIAIRAAEIATFLSEETNDPDLAAAGVSRSAEVLIRRARADLVLRALVRHNESEGDAHSLSRRQRRLRAVLKKPDCIRAVLESFESDESNEASVRLLDLAREHAAPLVLEFCSTSASPGARSRALAWFRGLPAETRASAISEHLSSCPDNAAMLEPVCEGIAAFQIGHCVDHLVAAHQASHTTAVLRVLGWCSGCWPASVVQHVTSTLQREVLDQAIRSVTDGPAETRSVTIARILCALVTLRQTPVSQLLPLIETLQRDQSVAERAFVDLLKVIRARPSSIAKGDAEPVLAALRAYPAMSESTRRALRDWRSPTVQLLSMVGRWSGRRGQERSCA